MLLFCRSRISRRLGPPLFFLILMCLPSARAQVSAGISGIVTDPSGAPVPLATITAKNLETGALRISSTNELGRYLFLSLPVGRFDVRVAKAGFQDSVRSGIQLAVGQE